MTDEQPHHSWLGAIVSRVLTKFGLTNDDGNLSFNKAITLGLFSCFVLILVMRSDPNPATLAFGIFVGVAGFGLKAVMAYMDRMTITSAFNTNTDVKLTGNLSEMIRAVKERRRAAVLDGTEDSGKVPQPLPVDG